MFNKVFLLLVVVFGIESRTLHVLGEYSTIEPHSQPLNVVQFEKKQLDFIEDNKIVLESLLWLLTIHRIDPDFILCSGT